MKRKKAASASSSVRNQMDTLYFEDGSTRIDFVLAFDDDHHEPDDEEDEEEAETMASRREKRASFQRNLKTQGLLLETEPAQVK